MPTDSFDRPVVVALFDQATTARAAAAALHNLGFSQERIGLLLPGQQLSISETNRADVSSLLALAAAATDGDDVGNVLLGMGLPAGEARFYAAEAREGRALLVVNANGRAGDVLRTLLEHGGYDVQSQGRDLIRPGESGVPGGVGPRPPDITTNWQDVRSRYEMLWQQHYGTTDATWEQTEPVYELAWRLANRPNLRGRPWPEAEAAVQREWSTSDVGKHTSWADAAGPIRDVWEDVTEEAATGAEGGADRRIAHQGTDQQVAARDLDRAPGRGAA
ncbi:MAG: hypothetical protein JO020_05545 [Chloroflexi bacterium]|nr:hypothetical protein [Chloroflexota bacterium]